MFLCHNTAPKPYAVASVSDIRSFEIQENQDRRGPEGFLKFQKSFIAFRWPEKCSPIFTKCVQFFQDPVKAPNELFVMAEQYKALHICKAGNLAGSAQSYFAFVGRNTLLGDYASLNVFFSSKQQVRIEMQQRWSERSVSYSKVISVSYKLLQLQPFLLTQTLCYTLSPIFRVYLSWLAFKIQHGKTSGSTIAPRVASVCGTRHNSFTVILLTSLWPALDDLWHLCSLPTDGQRLLEQFLMACKMTSSFAITKWWDGCLLILYPLHQSLLDWCSMVDNNWDKDNS